MNHKSITLPSPKTMTFWIEKALDVNYPHVIAFPTSDAPNSFSELQKWAIQHSGYMLGEHLIPIFNGGSDSTIFGTVEGNVMFRLWHDVIHLELSLSFNCGDEIKVCESHCSQLMSVGAPHSVVKAVEADVKGQVLYYKETKGFVKDQVKFVKACLKFGIESVIDGVKNGARY